MWATHGAGATASTRKGPARAAAIDGRARRRRSPAHPTGRFPRADRRPPGARRRAAASAETTASTAPKPGTAARWRRRWRSCSDACSPQSRGDRQERQRPEVGDALQVLLLCDVGESDQVAEQQEAHQEDARRRVDRKRVGRGRVDEHAAEPHHDRAQRILLVVPVVEHDRRREHEPCNRGAPAGARRQTHSPPTPAGRRPPRACANPAPKTVVAATSPDGIGRSGRCRASNSRSKASFRNIPAT